MKLILLFSFLLTALSLQAQFSYQKHSQILTSRPVRLDFRNLPVDWGIGIINEAPLPGIPVNPTLIENRKQQLSVKKHHSNQFKTNQLPEPTLNQWFVGNLFDNSTPNDNSIACNFGDTVLSVSNRRFNVYSGTGTLITGRTLTQVVNALGSYNSTFDPKVIFDPISNRFIAVFLNGFTDSTNTILLGFSETSDPSTFWNFYAINGNPINNNTWSDYPSISINQQDVFLTFNTFTNGSVNNSGYTESVIWQIQKSNGYDSLALQTNYYTGIQFNNKPLFNIMPIVGGSAIADQEMYFLSNYPHDTLNDTVFVLRIDSSLAAQNPQLSLQICQMDKKYGLPPSARMKGTTRVLDTNDGRVIGAILENGQIQFVQNSVDTTTNLCAVYHGKILLSNLQNGTASMIADTARDYAYPNIAWAGTSPTDHSVFIALNFSSPYDFPSYAAVYQDSMGDYSKIGDLKIGGNYIFLLTGNKQRWGDYTGIAQRWNEPEVCWISACYALSNRSHQTWISKIGKPSIISSVSNPEQNSTELFPNPVQDLIQYRFVNPSAQVLSFEIYDLQGKKVKTLLQDFVKSGTQIFSFQSSQLSSGIYFLQVRGKNLLLNHSFVKE